MNRNALPKPSRGGGRIWRWLLRPLGVSMLAGAYGVGRHLVAISNHVAGQQRPAVYGLAILACALLSTGAALLLEGARLFAPVRVAGRMTVARSPERSPSVEGLPHITPQPGRRHADAGRPGH